MGASIEVGPALWRVGPLRPIPFDGGPTLPTNNDAMIYISTLPAKVPRGWRLVHNHIAHKPRTPLGRNGFRAWLEPRGKTRRAICDCGWAAGLGKHLRVVLRSERA
jgi:hypothetical protein